MAEELLKTLKAEERRLTDALIGLRDLISVYSDGSYKRPREERRRYTPPDPIDEATQRPTREAERDEPTRHKRMRKYYRTPEAAGRKRKRKWGPRSKASAVLAQVLFSTHPEYETRDALIEALRAAGVPEGSHGHGYTVTSTIHSAVAARIVERAPYNARLYRMTTRGMTAFRSWVRRERKRREAE
jgi:hypothetical protein